jgi:hypothetical protein
MHPNSFAIALLDPASFQHIVLRTVFGTSHFLTANSMYIS